MSAMHQTIFHCTTFLMTFINPDDKRLFGLRVVFCTATIKVFFIPRHNCLHQQELFFRMNSQLFNSSGIRIFAYDGMVGAGVQSTAAAASPSELSLSLSLSPLFNKDFCCVRFIVSLASEHSQPTSFSVALFHKHQYPT
jgi:hypothetical protein